MPHRFQKARAHVLVIDDEKSVRDLFLHLLERQGHAVDVAADGAAALRMDARRPHDVVFCDLLLPGMSGLAVLTELLKRRNASPVVAMSGDLSAEIRSSSLLLGAFAFLPKPFELRSVEILIARALARKRA